MVTIDKKELITVSDAIQLLKKSDTAVYEAIEKRTISVYVYNGKYHLVKKEIEKASIEGLPRCNRLKNGFYPSSKFEPINMKVVDKIIPKSNQRISMIHHHDNTCVLHVFY